MTSPISVERNREGCLVLSSDINGYLVTRKYLYCTVREAKKLYREDTK